MRLTLSPEQRNRMANQLWFVHPNGDFIQRSIAEELIRRGMEVNIDFAPTTIQYKGRSRKSKSISGFHLEKNFDMIEWLVTTKSDLEGFDAYHAEFKEGPWEKFKKGEKTPAERMKKEPVTGQLRKKTTVHKKSALMFNKR